MRFNGGLNSLDSMYFNGSELPVTLSNLHGSAMENGPFIDGLPGFTY